MQNDFSNLKFSKTHKIDSAALDVITGIRLMILSFVLNLCLAALAINGAMESPFLPPFFAMIPGLVLFITGVAAFACAAYGIYLVVDALGWAGYIMGAFIVTMFVSFLRLLILIVLIILGLDLIGKSCYRFSLFGKPVMREAAGAG